MLFDRMLRIYAAVWPAALSDACLTIDRTSFSLLKSDCILRCRFLAHPASETSRLGLFATFFSTLIYFRSRNGLAVRKP